MESSQEQTLIEELLGADDEEDDELGLWLNHSCAPNCSQFRRETRDKIRFPSPDK